MSLRRSGLNPLAYLGVEPVQPNNFVLLPRAPTTTDFENFNIGDEWEDTTTQNVYKLVSVSGTIAVPTPRTAIWVLISSGLGDLTQLTASDATVATPVAGNITFPDAVIAGSGNLNSNLQSTAAAGSFTINVKPLINLPNTNAAGTQGQYQLGSSRFVHNFGTNNTFIGQGAGNLTLTVGSAVSNTAVGLAALDALTTGNANCALGVNSLTACTTSSNNLAIGSTSLGSLATGTGNNVAIGSLALSGITSGTDNTAIGQSSGGALTTNDSNNIMIGNTGIAGENNRIKIGTPVTHTTCFIAGIRGVTTGVADAIAVLIDSANQLGTVSSSERYKQNIQDMDDQSSIIMNLRPVTFNYKQHPEVPAWGLIAEEVAEIFPQLAVYDKEGEPEAVKYHELVPLLLNELQKLSKRVKELENKL